MTSAWANEGDWQPMSGFGGSVPFIQALAARHRLELRGSTPLAQAIALIEGFKLQSRAGGSLPRWQDESLYQYGRRVARLAAPAYAADFLTKVVHRGHLCGLGDDTQWLRAATRGHLPTDHDSRATDGKDRDVLWEYVLAGACATFCQRVWQEEPDVWCDFAGLKICIAAKMPASPDSMRTAAKKGARQIQDAAERGADVGIVLLNLLRAFDAPHFLANCWQADIWQPTRQGDELDAWLNRYRTSTEAAEMRERVRTKTSTGAVAYFVPALAMYRHLGGAPDPVGMYQLNWDVRDGSTTLACSDFLGKLHGSFQNVHAFKVAAP